MLTMNERLAIAAQLKKLREQLVGYQDRLFRELPKDIQQTIHAEPALHPITSSGLERTTAIIDRINLAVYYYTDPDFPQNYQPENQARNVKPAAVEVPLAVKKAVPTDTPVPTEPATLDFGPFDPRNPPAKGS